MVAASVDNMPDLTPMAQTACERIIQTLERQLVAARRLQDAYGRPESPEPTLVPIRHFCAELVEAAIELSREIRELPCKRTQSDGNSDPAHGARR